MDYLLSLNYPLLILVLTPFFYFVYRDIRSAKNAKIKKDEQEKTVIESEKRVYEMLKEMQRNRIEIVKNLESLRDEMAKSKKNDVLPNIIIQKNKKDEKEKDK